MQNLVEDFLSYLRHERGCSPQTQKTYAALLMNFTAWAGGQGLQDWSRVTLSHLMAFMEHERARALKDAPPESGKKLSSETLYLQIAALREQAGLSQAQLATLIKTSQQQISRLESPGYEGHSLATLRRVAKVLHARVRVVFEPEEKETGKRVAEAAARHASRRHRRDGEVDHARSGRIV